MVRGILAVLAGFVLWTVLWLGGGAVLAAVLPGAFRPDGGTDSVGVLLLLLAFSVFVSIASGYLTAAFARRDAQRYVLALGLVLLAVGVFVQIQAWDLLPLWYHLPFLALLIPAALVGGHTRLDRRPTGALAR